MPLILLLVFLFASDARSQSAIREYLKADTRSAAGVSMRDSSGINLMNWVLSIDFGHDQKDSLLVCVSDCEMYEKPDSLGKSVKHIRKYSDLHVLGHDSDFYKVELEGLSGYISKNNFERPMARLHEFSSSHYPVWIAGRDTGAYLIDPDNLANPLKMKILDHKGPISASISRRFDNAIEEKLLCMAEALYPPPFKYQARYFSRDTLVITAADGVDLKRDWWYCRYGPYLLPATITKDAIDYYLRFAAKEWSVEWSEEDGFNYEADIVPLRDGRVGGLRLENSYLVSMELRLRWRMTDIWRERHIILDSNGNVLATMGDGRAPTKMYGDRISVGSTEEIPAAVPANGDSARKTESHDRK